MSEFISTITAPQNVVLTIMLAACIAYWAFVVVFGLSIELFDGITGFFLPDNVDPTTGMDTQLDSPAGLSITGAALRFLNFGEVPATIIASIILMFTWVGSMGTYGMTKSLPGWLQVLAFLGVCVGATLLSKLATQPLKDAFSDKEVAGPARSELIGRDCLLTTSVGEERSGTAEAKTDATRFIVIPVRSQPGQGELPKGARAVIVSVDPKAGGYLVALPGAIPTTTEGKSK